jgi:hypothetical protein
MQHALFFFEFSFSLFLQVNGVRHPYDIKCALPVDFRSDYTPSAGSAGSTTPPSTDIGNHYCFAVLPLATNTGV